MSLSHSKAVWLAALAVGVLQQVEASSQVTLSAGNGLFLKDAFRLLHDG
jgi:hypothetical protein